MTEKEAWLHIAAEYASRRKLPCLGLCYYAGNIMVECDLIEASMGRTMCGRVFLFKPSPKADGWYWPQNFTRATRDLRATAACFLAAMCDD